MNRRGLSREKCSLVFVFLFIESVFCGHNLVFLLLGQTKCLMLFPKSLTVLDLHYPNIIMKVEKQPRLTLGWLNYFVGTI